MLKNLSSQQSAESNSLAWSSDPNVIIYRTRNIFKDDLDGLRQLMVCIHAARANQRNNGGFDSLLILPFQLIAKLVITVAALSHDVNVIANWAKMFRCSKNKTENAVLLYIGVLRLFENKEFSKYKFQNQNISKRVTALAAAYVYLLNNPLSFDAAFAIGICQTAGMFELEIEDISYNTEISQMQTRAEVVGMSAIVGLTSGVPAQKTLDTIWTYADRYEKYLSEVASSVIKLRIIDAPVKVVDCLHSLKHLESYINTEYAAQTIDKETVLKAVIRRECGINFGITEDLIYKEVEYIVKLGISNINEKIKNSVTLLNDEIDWRTKSNFTMFNFKRKDIQQVLEFTVAAVEANNDDTFKHAATTTNGSSGIVPSVLKLLFVQGYRMDEIAKSFIIASSIAIIMECNASSSAAKGGCNLECGVSGALAAAIIVLVKGGSYEEAVSAAYLSYQQYMGAICSTIGGGVAIPCVFLNMQSAALAVKNAGYVLKTGYTCSLQDFDRLCILTDGVTKRMPKACTETCGCALPTTCEGNAKGKKMGAPEYAVDTDSDPVGMKREEVKNNIIEPKKIEDNRSILDVCAGDGYGSSSSHSLAPASGTFLMNKIIGGAFTVVEIRLYNSLAKTGEMHGTIKAVIAGIAGICWINRRFIDPYEYAQEKVGANRDKIKLVKEPNILPQNWYEVEVVEAVTGMTWTFGAESTGGGANIIRLIKGYSCHVTGWFPIVELVRGEKYEEVKTQEDLDKYKVEGKKIIEAPRLEVMKNRNKK